jgi:predicted  nucleic acid-binding Zn-ribbon protein
LSIEGGIPGNQQRLVCPNCGKAFFAWRPDEAPAQKIKCYFCRHEFADEAAMRPVPEPIPAATPAPAETAASPASVETAAPALESAPAEAAAADPTQSETPAPEPTPPETPAPEPTSEPA